MKRVGVVILNWNGKKFLEQFLPAVVSHSSAGADIIVADNASTDDSLDFVARHFPQVTIIRNTSNSGYAKGYNDALKNLSYEYFVLLNSDVEVTPGWLEPLVRLMDSDPSISACQPRILAFHNKKEFEYAGAAGGFIDKFGFPFC